MPLVDGHATPHPLAREDRFGGVIAGLAQYLGQQWKLIWHDEFDGTLGGEIKKASLPDFFEVDYVRVFELSK